MKKLMKQLTSLLAVLAITIGAVTCAAAEDMEDDFLEDAASPAAFFQTARLFDLFTHRTVYNGVRNQMQGACTDGRFIWAGWNNFRVITRLDLTTWELVKREFTPDEWPYGHVNDMTYNPNTNRLYVIAYKDDATRGDIAVVDPYTLDYLETIHLTYNDAVLRVGGIAYDRLADQYIVLLNKTAFAILDSDFQYVRTITTNLEDPLTLQGIETDGKYIYRTMWEKNISNVIRVFDFSGKLVASIDTGTDGGRIELEDITYDWDGNWYLNFSQRDGTGGIFTYTQFTESQDTSAFENLLGRVALPFDLNL